MFKQLVVAIGMLLIVLFYLDLARQTVEMLERRAERLGELRR